MSFLDAADGGGLDVDAATVMARLLRTAADIVDTIPVCDDVNGRLELWRRLADVMGDFDAMLPELPAP
jgi:hypothetical protein